MGPDENKNVIRKIFEIIVLFLFSHLCEDVITIGRRDADMAGVDVVEIVSLQCDTSLVICQVWLVKVTLD